MREGGGADEGRRESRTVYEARSQPEQASRKQYQPGKDKKTKQETM